jgi:hypothetical protein
MSTVELIFGFLGASIILGLFILMGVMLHMAYTKEDVLLEYFKNSSVSAPMKHSGLMGRLRFIGGVSALVTFPRIHLKHGRVSAEDLSNCPAPLKRKLVILQWAGIVLMSLLTLLWVIGKIVGWL